MQTSPSLHDALDTNAIASMILKHAGESGDKEENLKIRTEATFRPILEKWGIQWASYERRLEFSGREDALYGRVIMEYKKPGTLDSKAEFKRAKEQVKEYIIEEAGDEASRGRFFGVVLDGYNISFVRFRNAKWEEQEQPLKVNAQTVLRLLESIRGLRRKPIDAEFLLRDFGPKSELSRKVISTLYASLADKNSKRTDMLFNDWKRVFSQVCAYSTDKLKGLLDYYELEGDADVEKLLFAIHTYYTVLMKLLTSEIVTLFADSLLGSYLKRVEESYYRGHDEMKVELTDLEEGGVFAMVGIRNFLEADYFAWYLDEWSEKIAKSIYELTTRLLDYEPATVELNPERVKDLFKRLYQNLVPRDIRHSIGEYFTPDWLADLLLDDIGYEGDPEKRVLDPSCGSGTFLVLAIKRVREYAEEHFQDQRELITKIVENVRGIDLNPLAVLASKANYIIALSDLLRYRPKNGIEIPIYLADSISVVRKVTPYGEDEFELSTNVGKFWIAKEVIDKGLLNPLLTVVSECAKNDLTKEQFRMALSKQIPLSDSSVSSFARLYQKILGLEKEGRNKIWTSLLKNSFSPLLIGKFDYVIGNPPWINWENLPDFYRDSTKWLWDEYGLLEKTKGMGLGKAKRDISMLFVARCFDEYVGGEGKLGFLIPFTNYKTQAGAGFRKWLSNKCQVIRINDLVETYPFEGATNRTSSILISSGKTSFPIQCTMWHNPKSSGIPMEADLTLVKTSTTRFQMILAPISKQDSGSSWMILSPTSYEVLQRVMRPSEYEAHAGIFTGLNSAYFVEVLGSVPNGALLRNQGTSGKRKLRIVQTVLESDLVYPLVRGHDHKKWSLRPGGHIVLPADGSGETLSHNKMKEEYPQTYHYFKGFQQELISRSAEPYKSKLQPYRKETFTNAEKKSPPFYWLFNAKPSLAPYKVMWKYIAGRITGKGEFSAAVIEPVTDKELGKRIPVPNEKLMLVPFDHRDEAYYVAALLNSSIAQLIVMSYTIETAISTHVLKHVFVPSFDANDQDHVALAKLSIDAHHLAEMSEDVHGPAADDRLKQVETRIDEESAKIYGISSDELREIKKTLLILRKGQSDEQGIEDDEDGNIR